LVLIQAFDESIPWWLGYAKIAISPTSTPLVARRKTGESFAAVIHFVVAARINSR
jgi:hypothetical protein